MRRKAKFLDYCMQKAKSYAKSEKHLPRLQRILIALSAVLLTVSAKNPTIVVILVRKHGEKRCSIVSIKRLSQLAWCNTSSIRGRTIKSFSWPTMSLTLARLITLSTFSKVSKRAASLARSSRFVASKMSASLKATIMRLSLPNCSFQA